MREHVALQGRRTRMHACTNACTDTNTVMHRGGRTDQSTFGTRMHSPRTDVCMDARNDARMVGRMDVRMNQYTEHGRKGRLTDRQTDACMNAHIAGGQAGEPIDGRTAG